MKFKSLCLTFVLNQGFTQFFSTLLSKVKTESRPDIFHTHLTAAWSSVGSIDAPPPLCFAMPLRHVRLQSIRALRTFCALSPCRVSVPMRLGNLLSAPLVPSPPPCGWSWVAMRLSPSSIDQPEPCFLSYVLIPSYSFHNKTFYPISHVSITTMPAMSMFGPVLQPVCASAREIQSPAGCCQAFYGALPT